MARNLGDISRIHVTKPSWTNPQVHLPTPLSDCAAILGLGYRRGRTRLYVLASDRFGSRLRILPFGEYWSAILPMICGNRIPRYRIEAILDPLAVVVSGHLNAIRRQKMAMRYLYRASRRPLINYDALGASQQTVRQ